jgi:hypothetical protein
VTLRQAHYDTVRFTAPLMVWQGEAHGGIGYVLIAGEAAEAIRGHELMRRLELGRRRGFGSVKITVRVGGSEWRTSVFPQKGGGWFLPVKKAIQRAEGLAEGQPVEVELELL